MKWYSPIFCALVLTACTPRQAPAPSPADSLVEQAGAVSGQEALTLLDSAFALASREAAPERTFAIAERRYQVAGDVSEQEKERRFAQLKAWVYGHGTTSQAHFEIVVAAGHYLSRADYGAAYGAYARGIAVADRAADTAYAIYGRLLMADLSQQFNDLGGSEEAATEVIRLVPKVRNATDRANLEGAYSVLGNSYLYRDEPDKAAQYFRKAASFSADFPRRMQQENNLAFALIRKRKYDDAMALLAPLAARKEASRHRAQYAQVLKNLGYARFCKDPAQGEKELLAALDIRESDGLTAALPSVYMDLAEFHAGKNPALSLGFARKAYAVATGLGSPDDRLEALRHITRIRPDDIASYRLINAIGDSIASVRRKARNDFAALRYDKRELETANNALVIENLRRRTHLTIASAACIVVLLLAGLLYYKERRDRERRAYLAETRVSKRLHDEVAGDLSQTLSFAESHDLSQPGNRQLLLRNLDNLYDRTRDISRAHSDIATGSGFRDELRQLIASFRSGKVQIVTIGFDDIAWEKLRPGRQRALFRAVQEWLTNMRKHSDAGMVTLRFGQEKRKLTVRYTDNGSVRELKNPPHGLHNVENRIREQGGSLTFGVRPERGFRSEIELPC